MAGDLSPAKGPSVRLYMKMMSLVHQEMFVHMSNSKWCDQE